MPKNKNVCNTVKLILIDDIFGKKLLKENKDVYPSIEIEKLFTSLVVTVKVATEMRHFIYFTHVKKKNYIPKTFKDAQQEVTNWKKVIFFH